MEVVNWERWARAAGAGFVALAVAAFIVGGEAPTVGDSTDDLISYYDGDRGKVLVASLLFAFALGFFLWFAAAIANLLRERGEGRVAATVIGAATAFVTLQLVLTGMAASLAYSIASGGDPGIVKALFDLQWVLDIFAALPAAVFVLSSSVGFMRTRAVPSWLCWAGVGLAALFLLRSTNWARDGFWSPTGEYVFILIPAAMLWILVTSITLVRAVPSNSEAAEPPPAATSSAVGT
jgi:hypothetical protein